jgi:para-nitrobenzyl esterase
MVAGWLGNAGLSRRAVIGGGLAISLAGRAGATSITLPEIQASSGRFVGDYPNSASAVQRYIGIRYGLAQRFQPPIAVPDNGEPQFAVHFGSVCPQNNQRYQPQSEDCLFLNVWTKSDAVSPKKPVLVYFHGGAYATGSVTDPLNDGGKLADSGDVVVVTVNHRLNALGYLYLPDRFPDSGNNGQLDLILALKWVKRNIASFGGDPGNVTLFGQSGGGAKIATLMAMPEAAGLFHKAITMSGQQVTASGPLNARKRAQVFLDKLGSNVDPATAPVEQLIAALSAADPVLGGAVYMGPVLDMKHLLRHPFWPDAAPQSRHIPMLLGNTVAETRAFFPPDHAKLQGLDWNNLASRMAPEMRIDIDPEWVLRQFRARYPAASPEEQFHRIVTAARSWRGQVEEAEVRARAGRGNTFVYQLDFEEAKHTDDIGLMFGTFENATPARAAMSERMMDACIRFARTGDPGWAAYTLPGRETMVFNTSSRVVNDPRQWERELFARVPYVQPGS